MKIKKLLASLFFFAISIILILFVFNITTLNKQMEGLIISIIMVLLFAFLGYNKFIQQKMFKNGAIIHTFKLIFLLSLSATIFYLYNFSKNLFITIILEIFHTLLLFEAIFLIHKKEFKDAILLGYKNKFQYIIRISGIALFYLMTYCFFLLFIKQVINISNL